MIEIKSEAYSGSIDDPLPLGRMGEHNVRTIIFNIADLKAAFGEGQTVLWILNPATTVVHEVSDLREDGDYIYWDVTSEETVDYGHGKLQLGYAPVSSSEQLIKSRCWNTYIEKSLRGV